MSVCDCDFILNNINNEWEEHYDNCKSRWLKNNRGKKLPRNNDGTLSLPNPYLEQLPCDYLYHLALDTVENDLAKMFGDVKFVCMGGTEERMLSFAKHIANVLNIPENNTHENLTKASHRYAMFKIGPVLSVSHGIGIPSMTILLQEVIKLLQYAKAINPIIFRIGTSGGLGVTPGSVVISSFGLNGVLEKNYDIAELGKIKHLPAIFDKRLSQELLAMSKDSDGFETLSGGTLAADDFYRGQARLDGPFCDHTDTEKMEFLKKIMSMGVRNVEMEATAVAALSTEAGLRAADICVTLLDRLNGDQVSTPKKIMLQWQERPMLIVGRYIEKYYQKRFTNGH